MLRAAIIGCGTIAQVHKEVLLALPEAELVACCDIKKERAKAFALSCGIRSYSSMETMLEQEQLDVVHLCVPHPLHTPLAKLCVGKGIHVFTEKPPSVDEEQFQDFLKLQDSEQHIGICFQNRYNQSVQKTIELLNSGEAGNIKGARAILTWHRDAKYYQESDWRGRWQTEGGGVLINQAIHTLDLLVFLLGKADSVQCHMSNHSLQDVIEVEDTLEASIKFTSGVSALFYASNAYCSDAPVLVEIVCEKAIIRLEGDKLTIEWKDGRRYQIDGTGRKPLGKDYWGNSHYICIQDFYESIVEDRPYQNDIPSVLDTMQLMFMMYQSYLRKRIAAK